MSEQDIADIIATSDGDTSWGADMRGAFTTLQKDRMSAIALDLSRGSGLTRTPTRGMGAASTGSYVAGEYRLSIAYVMGGYTPGTVSLGNVGTAGATSANFYYVIADIAADGFPGAIAASWGPFDCTTIGTKTLTSQTTAMPGSGWYWVGGVIAADSANGATIDVNLPLDRIFATADERMHSITKTGSGHNTPANLSAVSGWTADRFTGIPHVTMS